MNEFENQPTF